MRNDCSAVSHGRLPGRKSSAGIFLEVLLAMQADLTRYDHTPLIPAKAGIQPEKKVSVRWQKLGPRVRGDERLRFVALADSRSLPAEPVGEQADGLAVDGGV